MKIRHNERRPVWAPLSCTLPATRLPRRVAEFDALFTDAVRGIERVGPERLRLELQASPQAARRAAELAAAETQCCSFFTFTLTATGDGLALEVSVPEPYARVLDGLAGRAAAAVLPARLRAPLRRRLPSSLVPRSSVQAAPRPPARPSGLGS